VTVILSGVVGLFCAALAYAFVTHKYELGDKTRQRLLLLVVQYTNELEANGWQHIQGGSLEKPPYLWQKTGVTDRETSRVNGNLRMMTCTLMHHRDDSWLANTTEKKVCATATGAVTGAGLVWLTYLLTTWVLRGLRSSEQKKRQGEGRHTNSGDAK